MAARRKKIGIALGSGGAWGWAHIGVLDALAELGIVPDAVAGTSMGAVVGAAYASGRLDQLREAALALGWRDVVGMIDVKLATGGLVDGARIEAFLTRLGISGAVEACPRPFGTVGTDLAGGEEVWLREGPIEKAVRGSIGIPGIFTPMRHGEGWLVDGGVINPIPVSLCRALGADIVIAVDVTQHLTGKRFLERGGFDSLPSTKDLTQRLAERIPVALRAPLSPLLTRLMRATPSAPSYFAVITDSLQIVYRQMIKTRLATDPPDILLHADLGTVQAMEFYRAEEAIAAGRACVAAAKDALARIARA